MPTTLSWELVEVVDTVNQAVLTARQQSGLTVAKNFLLTSAGELDFSGGRLNMAYGAEAVAQSLSLRLQAVEGDWFLDTTLGLPLFTEIIGAKNPDLVAIRALYREVILGTPGILELLAFTMAVDTSRALTLAFSTSTDFGELVATGVVTQ
jgi:hypothetical protein